MAQKVSPPRRESIVNAVRDRSVLLLTWVTICGIMFVVAGWLIDGWSYLPGLLLELGVSLMLLVPLALLGLVLEKRVRQAEEQIRTTTARLDALSAVTRERLIEHRRQRADLFRDAERNPTQGLIRVLFRDALAVGAVASEGLRVRIPSTHLRLRLYMPSGTSEDLGVKLEEEDGTPRQTLSWPGEETAEEFAARLAEILKAQEAYPGDQAYDPSGLLLRFVQVLHTAVDARTGERAHDLGTVVEMPNDQWAVSLDGLHCMIRVYDIPIVQLDSVADWPAHMRSREWADIAKFREAYRLARLLLLPRGSLSDRAQRDS
ncbi:hypothetical protein ABZ897_46580 [Nonomuraea sp. NPDC046802]|uniref:hypothetical protein n=1 Tax=Nonomuraea sp. NPDC046802 TaxID=3154919 RepID=UPI0033C4C09E